VADYKAVPFVPMEAIPQGGQYEPRYDQKPGADITSGTYFERGDLLIAKITPSFENGKQAWVKRLPAPFGYATTEVIPLRPTAAGYDRRLLFFYLLHPEIRSYVSERMEGSTGRQRVPEQVLLDLPYPKLPPDDQQAIADTLERVTLQVDLEEHSARTAAELKRAAMRELFTRGLRGEPQKETEIGPVPESWETRTILDLCEIWSGGTPRKSVAEYWKGDIPWVSGKDLKTPALDDTIDHVSAAGVEAASRLAPAGAVLLLVRGMGLAKDLPVAVINRPMAFNQDVKALVSRGEYPGQFLRSAIYAGKDRLLSQIVPSAHGTMTLNLNDVETFKVACPTDPDEAAEIVAILDAIDRKIDLHRKKRAVLEDLFKALLHKLMTGEIRVDALDLSALQAHAEPLSPALVPAV
jgi:type I restriction enzyme S subunit